MSGPSGERSATRRRRRHRLLWRLANPVIARVAGLVPWWVLLETTGRRTGRPRRTPLATGPSEPAGMWLNAVHGQRASWVKNIQTEPRVRVRVRGHWRTGDAAVHPASGDVARRFNAYARSGPQLFGVEPALVFVRWDPALPDPKDATTVKPES